MSEKKSYPEQIQRLERIVQELKQANTPIDTAIALFKEGQTIVTECKAYLTAKTTEIEVLQKSETEN